MALFPRVNTVVAATKHVPSSQLGHQKNNFHQELISDRGECLKDLYAGKSQSYSYSLCAESSQYSSSHGGFCSGGQQSKYLASQTKPLPIKSVARRKEGVDHAYPLKQIFHHKGVSVPVVNTAQLRSSPYMEETPNSRPSSMNKRKPPAGTSQLAAVPKQSASHLYTREWAHILKLEADGWKLEEEIQKKKALLREKLRRTKELLRGIQREKQLLEAEERTEREVERTLQKTRRHLEEKTLRVAVRPGDGVFGGVQPAEATIPKPGTTLHCKELGMGKLKKEQLVDSNSKIQKCRPMEHLVSCSKLPQKCSLLPSALSDQDSGDHLSTEMLCVQAASAADQGGLGQCSFCGRRFVCTRLEKHMSICAKSQSSRRKAFDSSKARARGTELEQYQQWKSLERPQVTCSPFASLAPHLLLVFFPP